MLNKTVAVLALAGFMLTPSGSTFASAEAEKTGATNITSPEGANIKILSPADGAHLKAGEQYLMPYEITVGKGGDHFHVWVDGKSGPSIYETKGAYTLPKLASGQHIITVKIVASDHIPTGPMRSIKVIVDPDSKG
jgi:hypothetical protein